MSMREFMNANFRHFNARETREAAQAWVELIERGDKMFLSIAGAMSTAQLGKTLARMIRERKVHGISATGANVEEDLFNLLAREKYKRVSNYRDLSPQQEAELYKNGFNRVTDVCIPEFVFYQLEDYFKPHWTRAEQEGTRHTPWEIIKMVIDAGEMKEHYQVPPEESWVLAAHEMNIPVWVPGWEDSTLGSGFASEVVKGEIVSSHNIIKSGTEQLVEVADWYREQSKAGTRVGFFQIGGGIAGDFAICAVPLLIQDLKEKDIPYWSYFAQISDSSTSYGSYSGAVPNEKITWGKLDTDSPTFMIQSDATIVAPLVFAYVLDA